MLEQKITQNLSQKLTIWPDSILSRKAEPITIFDTKLTQDIINLHNIFHEFNGLGLSGCQIGDNRAFFVYKVKDCEGVMINPQITFYSTLKHDSHEGCLSIPGVYVKVERANNIKVQYQDEEGILHEDEYLGLLADCIQHEVDHLQGITILSYLSTLKRDIVTRKMKKVQKQINRVKSYQ